MFIKISDWQYIRTMQFYRTCDKTIWDRHVSISIMWKKYNSNWFLHVFSLSFCLFLWLPFTVAQPPGNLWTDHRTPVAARAALLDGPVSLAAGSEACRVRHTRCWLWWGLSGHLHRRCVSALPLLLPPSLYLLSLSYLTVSFLFAARRPRTKTIWEWWGLRTCWMPQRDVAMVRWIPGTVIIGICLALGETAIAMRGAPSLSLALFRAHN